MDKKEKGLIHLGFSNRPHGIKGGFQFKLFNNDDSVLNKGSEISIFPKDQNSSLPQDGKIIKIENIHFGNKTICYLSGIKDRNIVEEYLPFDIYYPRDKFPQLDSDEIYINDLIGLKVLSPAGVEIGEVATQYDNGAQTILKLRLQNRTLELPFVNVFFPEVDLENKTITLVEPEVEG